MALHKLLMDDFDDDIYLLIAIHCGLKDYRLAYILNKTLHLNLSRTKKDIDFKRSKANYALFEWEDDKKLNTWHLISNRCKQNIEAEQNTVNLFSSSLMDSKIFHLIPEYKKADYFLKVTNDSQSINLKIIVGKLQKLPNVITSYAVNPTKLKSKAHLIF